MQEDNGARNEQGSSPNGGEVPGNQVQDQQDLNRENPQRGSDWNNYQTKELSTSEETGGGISAEEAAEAFTKE